MTTTIHYWVSEGSNNLDLEKVSPFSLEMVQPNLTPWTDSVDKNVIHAQCPVWNHRNKRNFVVHSAIDFSFKYNRNAPIPKKLELLNLNRDMGDIIILQDGWDYSEPVFQFRFPMIVFWTNKSNVWIESKPHPYTAARNNFVSIGGWWNLSKWNRSINFAVQMVDENKPFTIKRGDPLFEVSFYNQSNLKDDIKLVRELEIPEKIWNEQHRNTNVKRYLKMMNPRHLFTDKPKSKCPFSFLTK